MTRFLCAAAAATAVTAAAVASAKIELEYKGYIHSDIRFSLPGKAFERAANELRFNENHFALQTDLELNPKVSARAAVRTVFIGFSNVPTGRDLTQRAQIDPFWWEMDAAYIDLRDIGVEGLDVRLGRQILHWGVADQFNPTNNLVPYDFRDPLLFGQNLANNMIKVDYAPGKNVVMTGVWVPVFRPSQIPVFGLQALTDTSAFEKRFGGTGDPNIEAFIRTLSSFTNLAITLEPNLPSFSLGNSMAAAKVGFKIFGADLSLSYFRGFFSLPRPSTVTTSISQQGISAKVALEYPQFQALGFDFTTSIKALGGMGLWVEGTVNFHDALRTKIDLGGLPCPIANNPECLLTEQDGGAFLKLTAGIDFTFNKYVYTNLQYLHGFIDEFGQRNIKDYVVAGVDFKNAADNILFRVFAVLNLQDQSHVWYPVLVVKPWGGSEFHAGALLYGGQAGSKFATPETGSNLFFIKGRLSF